MRKISSVLYAAVLLAYTVPGVAADTAVLNTEPEKNGYSVGYDLGRSIHRQLADVDPESMARGLKDAMTGATSALPEEEMQRRFTTVRQESVRKVNEQNKKDGEAFLAKNKGEKGVKSTASGLQYKVITTGKGKQPTADDTVTVHYRGTLIDGTEFDSSFKRNQPVTFPVKGVIPGWTEALQLMKEGSKWMLYLPSTIAYGERGAGNIIGPNSVLIFEVELLSIKNPNP